MACELLEMYYLLTTALLLKQVNGVGNIMMEREIKKKTNFASKKACTTGWFGDSCELKCLCHRAGCAASGSCDSYGGCKVGYFGPSCQYLDQVYYQSDDSTPDYLKDFSDTTCSESANESICVTFVQAISLYWIRLHIDKSGLTKHVPRMTLTLNKNEQCKDMQMFTMSDGNMDILCAPTLTKSITLIWKFAPTICSIHVSGGRNVALRQRAQQSQTDGSEDLYGADKAVDGNADNTASSNSCALVAPGQGRPFWKVTFSKPQRVFSILIYIKKGEENGLRGFNLAARDGDERGVMNYTHKRDYMKDVVSLTNVTLQAISSITIYQSPFETRRLSLCEVLVFGETICPEGMYNLSCNSICDCGETMCHPETGKCMDSCENNFNSFNCQRRRYVCPDGKFGYNCSKSCPNHCAGGICNIDTGLCERCEEGSPGCQVCQSAYFGLDCSRNCPENCADTCDPETGFCDSCKTGYTGDTCKRLTVTVAIVTTTLIIITILFVVIIVAYTLKKKNFFVYEEARRSSEPNLEDTLRNMSGHFS